MADYAEWKVHFDAMIAVARKQANITRPARQCTKPGHAYLAWVHPDFPNKVRLSRILNDPVHPGVTTYWPHQLVTYRQLIASIAWRRSLGPLELKRILRRRQVNTSAHHIIMAWLARLFIFQRDNGARMPIDNPAILRRDYSNLLFSAPQLDGPNSTNRIVTIY
uniref:Uncharacterized protein n=1 Tax=Globodera rostochiensis TaxID=31243 RepID=A0A914I4E7_GLORO